MQLTESQLKKIIIEELNAIGEEVTVNTKDVVESIYINAMDGAPLSFELFASMFMPMDYFMIRQNKSTGETVIVPSQEGIAFLKSKGVEVEKY